MHTHGFVTFTKGIIIIRILNILNVYLKRCMLNLNWHNNTLIKVNTTDNVNVNIQLAVLLNNQLGELFLDSCRSLSGVPTFACALRHIPHAGDLPILQHHHIISIGGRSICNRRFADDIDLMRGS